jgi:hypothetical protein
VWPLWLAQISAVSPSSSFSSTCAPPSPSSSCFTRSVCWRRRGTRHEVGSWRTREDERGVPRACQVLPRRPVRRRPLSISRRLRRRRCDLGRVAATRGRMKDERARESSDREGNPNQMVTPRDREGSPSVRGALAAPRAMRSAGSSLAAALPGWCSRWRCAVLSKDERNRGWHNYIVIIYWTKLTLRELEYRTRLESAEPRETARTEIMPAALCFMRPDFLYGFIS